VLEQLVLLDNLGVSPFPTLRRKGTSNQDPRYHLSQAPQASKSSGPRGVPRTARLLPPGCVSRRPRLHLPHPRDTAAAAAAAAAAGASVPVPAAPWPTRSRTLREYTGPPRPRRSRDFRPESKAPARAGLVLAQAVEKYAQNPMMHYPGKTSIRKTQPTLGRSISRKRLKNHLRAKHPAFHRDSGSSADCPKPTRAQNSARELGTRHRLPGGGRGQGKGCGRRVGVVRAGLRVSKQAGILVPPPAGGSPHPWTSVRCPGGASGIVGTVRDSGSRASRPLTAALYVAGRGRPGMERATCPGRWRWSWRSGACWTHSPTWSAFWATWAW
jgi:hypothetical protein